MTGPDGSTTQYNPTGEQAYVPAAAVGQAAAPAGTLGTQSNPAPLVNAANVQGSQTDENGHTSHYQTGAFGLDTSDTDALGNSTSTIYNPEGLPTQITAPPLTPGGQPLVTVNTYIAGLWDCDEFVQEALIYAAYESRKSLLCFSGVQDAFNKIFSWDFTLSP